MLRASAPDAFRLKYRALLPTCLQCGRIVRHEPMGDLRKWFWYEHGKRYFRCPHCGKKKHMANRSDLKEIAEAMCVST